MDVKEDMREVGVNEEEAEDELNKSVSMLNRHTSSTERLPGFSVGEGT